MKMHILSGGRLRMRKSVYVPDAERSENMELPVSCYLLRHAQGNVLFDTGCHPSVHDNAEARWGGMARFMTPIGSHDQNVVDQLALAGLQPDDIDVVVNSHFHSDHCGCNEFFRMAAAQAEDGPQRGYLPADWKQPMPIDAIENQRDLFNDGRIVLLPMPGHTVGMTTALVELEKSGRFLLASDAVPLQVNLERDVHPKNTWNVEQSAQSMDEVRRIAAGGATVLYGHDDQQWQSLQTGAAFYD
jgi:glyoxylase-like metal-dependent hydrolase (beta-lactamase superfamily II)